MIMWHKVTLTALLALFVVAPAQAEKFYRERGPGRAARVAPLAGDDRRVWRFDLPGGGTFEHLRGDTWAQFYQDKVFYFREVARTPDYVQIYDDGRGLPVRLYEGMVYQDNGNGWEAMSRGH